MKNIMNENNLVTFKQNSSLKMKFETTVIKRNPLQCISNINVAANKQLQLLRQNSFNESIKLQSLDIYHGKFENISIKNDSLKFTMVNDENIKENVKLPSMECDEIVDEFLDDSYTFYSFEEDFQNNILFKNRLNNLVNISEYRDDMHKYLREKEIVVRPNTKYMNNQMEITAKMRSIMVDWMIDVVEEFKFDRETLHLAVNYVDRFLSVMSVARTKLQLVGTTALLIAGKFEEIYPPGIKDYSFITDDTYTIEQVIRMEHLMLKILEFDIAIPTASGFCELYIKETCIPSSTAILSRYLVDISLLYSDPFLNYLPSEIASSAIFFAIVISNQTNWILKLELVTQYNIADLKTCMYCFYIAYNDAISSPFKALRNKYESIADLDIPPFSMLKF